MVFKLHFCHSASLHFRAKVQLKNHRLSRRYAGLQMKELKLIVVFLAFLALFKYLGTVEFVAPYLKFIVRCGIGVAPVILFYDIYRVHKMAFLAAKIGSDLPKNLENRYGGNITKLEPKSLLLVARLSLAVVVLWVPFICWYSYTSLSR